MPASTPRTRRSIRRRLTALYGGTFLLAGAALLAITYLLVAHIPVLSVRHTTAPPDGAGPRPLPGTSALDSDAGRQRAADLHHLLVQSGIALTGMAVVCVGIGWLVAGRVLRPLRTITAATQRISANSLHQRLALPGPDDELKALGDTIDSLLARLQRSFTSQRQFVANASHELRTPLTLQRALLEATLTAPDPTLDAWRTTCERALVAGGQQERLIEALLTLARSEAGLDRRRPVDLAEIVDRVLAAHAAADDGGPCAVVSLRPALVSGDPRLLERLVVNLVDNAYRYNVERGRVEVGTAVHGGCAVLSVANTGPVVRADQLERLFEPFRRLTDDRTRDGDGDGLGLSIVHAVVTAHDGRVRAQPRPSGGLQFVVSLPAAVGDDHVVGPAI